MSLLKLNHVQKSFGNKKVLADVDLEVPKGAIYGFIGQNGAGKTTTMKLILGLLKMDSGKILVENESVIFGGSRTNRLIGYLPDVPDFYSYLTAKEYLELCGKLQKIDSKSLTHRILEMLDFVGLDADNRKIRGYSRGMKQRLGVAQALLAKPALLICDEPTSALDPIGRKEILDLFQQISQETTILFSTHILSDVENICDHVAILHDGEIKEQGLLSELKAKHGKPMCLVAFAQAEEQLKFLQQTSLDCQIKNGTEITIPFDDLTKEIPQQVFQKLNELEIVPQRFNVQQPSLEEVFLEVIR